MDQYTLIIVILYVPLSLTPSLLLSHVISIVRHLGLEPWEVSPSGTGVLTAGIIVQFYLGFHIVGIAWMTFSILYKDMFYSSR